MVLSVGDEGVPVAGHRAPRSQASEPAALLLLTSDACTQRAHA